jgi:hypothetical protein
MLYCEGVSVTECHGAVLASLLIASCLNSKCCTHTQKSDFRPRLLAGAVCGNSARTDLCGGGGLVTAISTATGNKNWKYLLLLHDEIAESKRLSDYLRFEVTVEN